MSDWEEPLGRPTVGHNGELISLGCSGSASVSPRRGGGCGCGEEGLGLAAEAFGPPTQTHMSGRRHCFSSC